MTPNTTNHEKRTPLYAVFERYPYSDPERLLGIFSTYDKAKAFIEKLVPNATWQDEEWCYVIQNKNTRWQTQIDYTIEVHDLDSHIVYSRGISSNDI